MEVLHMPQSAFHAFVDALIKENKQEIVGVKQKENSFAFDTLESAGELCLDYTETILPPKKYFLPLKEQLLSFKPLDAGSYAPIYDEQDRVVIGMHPADCAAIALLDKTFSEGEPDTPYLKRRPHITVIGIYPVQPYKNRFTSPFVTALAYKTCDLMLVDLGDKTFAIEVVTDKGKSLIAKAQAKTADAAVQKKMEERKKAPKEEVTLSMDPNAVSDFLNNKEKDPVFAKRAQRCFSCGSCTLVCPTCYCFNVSDEIELSLLEGRRVRSWDGCMLQGFAKVAGEHNFRKNPEDRLRHRIFRKMKYLKERFQMPGCVGCGRCGQACVAGIALPIDVINEMNGKGA